MAAVHGSAKKTFCFVLGLSLFSVPRCSQFLLTPPLLLSHASRDGGFPNIPSPPPSKRGQKNREMKIGVIAGSALQRGETCKKENETNRKLDFFSLILGQSAILRSLSDRTSQGLDLSLFCFPISCVLLRLSRFATFVPGNGESSSPLLPLLQLSFFVFLYLGMGGGGGGKSISLRRWIPSWLVFCVCLRVKKVSFFFCSIPCDLSIL